MSHHEHDHHEHDHHEHDGLPDLLDLDAEVLAGPLHVVLEAIDRLADAPVRSILDLGAGTGAGTFSLLQHFDAASAVSVDASEDMLGRLRDKAGGLGLSDRVSTVRADLDEGVPSLDPVDLAWASASLHHLKDPDATLAQLLPMIRPGGLLAVVELTDHPRFLPDDTVEGAVEGRAHDMIAADRAVDMPEMGSDWGSRLTRAGLTVEVERPVVVDLPPPHASVVGTYAAAALTRIQGAVAERMDASDRRALDALLDGGRDDVRRRSDLHIRAERQLWVARRA